MDFFRIYSKWIIDISCYVIFEMGQFYVFWYILLKKKIFRTKKIVLSDVPALAMTFLPFFFILFSGGIYLFRMYFFSI